VNDYKPVIEFDSWQQYIAATRVETDCVGGHSKNGDTHWIGCTLAEAKTFAAEGWVEGAERARKFTDLLTSAIGGLIDRVEINYDVEGHNIDVARFLENEPECWQRFDVERVQQPAVKYIRIVVNGAASSGVDAKTIMGRGACIAALVELLEYAGNRCEVVLAMATRSQFNLCALITVKKFDEPLDLPKIAYTLAHPSTLRVHHFAFMETMPRRIREGMSVPGGYGMCADVPNEKRGDIYLNFMQYGEEQWTSPSLAVEWVKKELTAFGVTMHEPADKRAL
jgi:hypothetical protein